MRISEFVRSITKSVPFVGRRHQRLKARVASLETALAGLRSMLAASQGRHLASAETSDSEVEAMLIRSGRVLEEIDRLNALYESLAVRIAQQERAPPKAVTPAGPLPVNSSTEGPGHQTAKEKIQALFGQVAKHYVEKFKSYQQLLVEKDKLRTQLGQLRLEYGRKVEAHDRSINQTNELLRQAQERHRTAGLLSVDNADVLRPAFPAEIIRSTKVFPIRVVDVGAQILTSEPHVYAPMHADGCCDVIGFEPLKEAAEKRVAQEPSVRMLNYFIGDGKRRTFRIARFDPTSSLLEADADFLNQFMALPEMCEPVDRVDVETVRLDNIPEIEDCDYLKLDVQGGELDALNGATRLLGQAIVVHTEVEFAPIYRNQPLFADVDGMLRSNGFELIDLMKFGYAGYKDLPNRRSVSRLMWCDAVYFKRPDLLAQLPREKLLKAAYIAHVNYGLLDLAAHHIARYDRAAGTSLLVGYLAQA